MEELLNKLIERDMVLGSKENAKALVEYANSRGYIARYFEDRKRPHVELKREGNCTTDKPIRHQIQ
ncbi:hypothetical protein ACK8P5_26490 (plasmid) [Paenibacillus sp. EC2-1]|uniref:hypothetical protein n=1 Tax=Paenibacillus sp. EC2-1 TaxID=3388665 RepID=UPI003BEECA64